MLLAMSYSSLALCDEEAVEDQPFWEVWKEAISDRVNNDLLATPDPWESWNRKVFGFNDIADRYVLTPVAKSYQWVTPDVVEQGVGNVFSNLNEVPTILNDLLQFKFGLAAADTGRFVLNSTIGLVGLFDVATPMGLEKHNEDFGQTLGYWGVGSGPYLVMPLLGSYNLRDGLGAFADSQTSLIAEIDHIPTRNQLYVLRLIDTRASLFAAEKLITGDKYAFIRDAYLQRREYLVNDGVVTDTFGDEDFEDDWNEEF
jgi:phospholipid-binding lipoprotein MlaA